MLHASRRPSAVSSHVRVPGDLQSEILQRMRAHPELSQLPPNIDLSLELIRPPREGAPIELAVNDARGKEVRRMGIEKNPENGSLPNVGLLLSEEELQFFRALAGVRSRPSEWWDRLRGVERFAREAFAEIRKESGEWCANMKWGLAQVPIQLYWLTCLGGFGGTIYCLTQSRGDLGVACTLLFVASCVGILVHDKLTKSCDPSDRTPYSDDV